MKYIIKFKDEHKTGANGRQRRTDEHSDGDTIRCLPCHRLLARVKRIDDKGDRSVTLANVSRDGRVQFLRDAEHSFGDDLAKKIRCTMEQIQVTQSISSFSAGGGFYDEIDMKEKYNGKPEQLANIFKYAHSFTCPIRKVKLYQDPEYVLSNIDKEMQENYTKIEASMETDVRAAKKQKKVKEEVDIGKLESKPLKMNQITKLNGLLEKLKKQEEALAACTAKLAGGVADHVPKFAIAKGEKATAAIKNSISLFDLAIAQSAGDYKHLVAESNQSLKESKTVSDMLGNFIDEAEAHLAAAS